MAKTVIIELVDDLDGTPAAETVRFALDGRHYEIDLSTANAARLREALAGFAGAARRQGPPRLRRTILKPQQRVIRDWAAAHGIKVSPRGRIPQTVVDRYIAAAA
ncbi:Lsr2 family protein [Sinomonas sp. ASV486]|uniref:histone-like nucleoid-structuring protein Lsr2 n=1 Tax=Sinomonas sp. ASV486 TaxID=3051170 RepID=UPI0027DE659B|nr:Lsr2 family protein [Sinomonas sp. ASV486]MDQ4490784.1 Lsr2 family protein [Sinomonas sp. ASV486]